MDYEKKYNEALKWMRELYPGLHGETKEDAEHFFPELRESEDERIRKEMVDYFSQYKDDGIRGVDITPWIAYLEKQKEQKHAPEDLQKSFEAGQKSIVDNPEMYGLCKPVEWSEDDRIMRDNLIIYFSGGRQDFMSNDAVKWLKSLRPQPHWKPSEEQIKTLYACINYLENLPYETDFPIDNLRSLYNDLLKLK